MTANSNLVIEQIEAFLGPFWCMVTSIKFIPAFKMLTNCYLKNSHPFGYLLILQVEHFSHWFNLNRMIYKSASNFDFKVGVQSIIRVLF